MFPAYTTCVPLRRTSSHLHLRHFLVTEKVHKSLPHKIKLELYHKIYSLKSNQSQRVGTVITLHKQYLGVFFYGKDLEALCKF